MTDISKLAEMDDKLEGRAEYLQGSGFDVELKVTYTRKRRVRALTEDQAKQFAKIREARYAPKYFHAQNHKNYAINDIEVMGVSPAPTKADKTEED